MGSKRNSRRGSPWLRVSTVMKTSWLPRTRRSWLFMFSCACQQCRNTCSSLAVMLHKLFLFYQSAWIFPFVFQPLGTHCCVELGRTFERMLHIQLSQSRLQ